MEGNLVIVESPAKAKTIQKYLGENYIVKSSFGHIRDLQDNKLSVDVKNGFAPEYIVPADKKKVVTELRKAAEKAEIVWLASDEDREGEAISWHLIEALGLDESRTRRIAFHEITRDAILNAIQNPRQIDRNLVGAQQARRVLDRLVGFELSPVLWRKIQGGLSAGRVQSVALRLVVDREREIMAFKPSPYYKVEALFRVAGVSVKGSLDTQFDTLEEARKFLEDSIGASFSVASVEKSEGSRYPAAPFTTSTLQQEASRKLNMPVSVTMRVAQSLYERGLITYMRTDSTNLSKLALGTSKDFILSTYGPEYLHNRQYTTKAKGAQEAHEAIRPTFISNTDIEGSAQERKLYNLIWKRTVASQMAEAKLDRTNIKVVSDKRSEKFSIHADEIRFDGFLKLYSEGTDDENTGDDENALIPEVHVGDIFEMKETVAGCKFSQAPYRYSEATLVKKLEELGIGRPSTYAPTISTLTTGRGYVTKADKEGRKVETVRLTLKGDRVSETARIETIGAERSKLMPQEIGMVVSDYLVANFPDIMSYDFTANVEQDFDKIAAGKMVWNKVISGFYGDFHNAVGKAMEEKHPDKIERILGEDPATGQPLIARFGKFGAYVQKGEGEARQCASLAKGQLIETITLEEALNLFRLPRTVGQLDGVDIIVLKGRFGPYVKYGDKNVSLPRGADPMKVELEQCIRLVQDSLNATPANTVILEFKDDDISVIDGRYGPYIKHAGANYKIPRGADASKLTLEECRKIVEGSEPSARRSRKYKK